MFRFFFRRVAVSFIDDATGKPIAASNVPIDQLPDSFGLATELDMEGAHYVVVRAEPQTKAEFAKTKRLCLTLRQVKLVDPKRILFSLPSICGTALPSCTVAQAANDIIVLHDDDWRQCEFIADTLHDDVAAELSSVRHIHAVARTEFGWRELHVRERIARPLPPGTRWAAVIEQLGAFETVGGIAFGDSTQRVIGAVAARLPDRVVLWGVEEIGELTALCVEHVEAASTATIDALKRVADAFSLTLIHWCRCQAYSAGRVSIPHAAGAPWDGLA